MKIILVTAVWCPSCLIMRPRYLMVFKKIPAMDFTEMDYDTDAEAIRPLNVGKVLPVVIGLVDGQEIFRIVGEKSVKDLDAVLSRYDIREK